MSQLPAVSALVRRSWRFLRSKHGWIAVAAVSAIWSATFLIMVGQDRAAAVVGAVVLSGVALLVIDQHKSSRLVLRAVARANVQRVKSDIHQLRADLDTGLREIRRTQREIQDDQIVTRYELFARYDLVAADLRSLSSGLTDTGNVLAREHRDLRRETAEHIRDIARRIEMARRRQDVVAENQISEVDALLQIRGRVPLEGSVPLLGSWAITPRGMLQLIDLIERLEPKLIVECGPGTSTVYAAATLRKLGLHSSRIIGLEHQREFADQTRAALAEHGLEEYAEVRHADLTEWHFNGDTYAWYDPAALEGIDDIDLLLVDGPPGTTGRLARYPAFPALKGRLRAEAWVLLDDARRDDERAIVDGWSAGGELRRVTSLSSDQAVLVFTPGPIDT